MLLALVLILLLLSGMPIYVALGLTSLLFMMTGTMDPVLFAKSLYAGADQYPLIAVTGFILVGNLFEKANITQEIIDFVRKFIGKSKTGLAIITIVSCSIFAAVSGSGPATVATIGGLMIPTMMRAGYPAGFAGAVAASGGALGVLIPPSNPFLMYGIIARESIAELFVAGLLPGLIMTIGLSITSAIIAKSFPAINNNADQLSLSSNSDIAKDKKDLWYTLKAIYDAKWALTAIIMLLGGIYAGFFTPIEAAEVTVFYTIFIGLFVTKTMKVRDIWQALISTMSMSGALLILTATATAFGRLITLYQLPQAMGLALSSISQNPHIILLIIAALMIFIGTWAETFSMIVVLTPIFLPIIKPLGIDPIQFGVIFVVCAEIGFLTPPFGCNLFVSMKLANLSLEAISKSVLPFVLTYVIVLLLLIFFPSISTIVPKLIFG